MGRYPKMTLIHGQNLVGRRELLEARLYITYSTTYIYNLYNIYSPTVDSLPTTWSPLKWSFIAQAVASVVALAGSPALSGGWQPTRKWSLPGLSRWDGLPKLPVFSRETGWNMNENDESRDGMGCFCWNDPHAIFYSILEMMWELQGARVYTHFTFMVLLKSMNFTRKMEAKPQKWWHHQSDWTQSTSLMILMGYAVYSIQYTQYTQ